MRFVALIAVAAVLLIGCASSTAGSAPPSYGPDVVHLGGVRDVRFGDTVQELTERGHLDPRTESCGPRLSGLDAATPVFADERLVLLWLNPPLRTPQGVTVGTPITDIRTAYDEVAELSAPEGTYRFDGLMATEGDRAYLFLHDGDSVRKAIAGYEEYARRLFDAGFGAC